MSCFIVKSTRVILFYGAKMDIKNFFTAKNISFTLLVLFIMFLLVKMTDIALLLFCSYVISSAINPFVDKLSEKMPRTAAVVTMITLVSIIILGVFIPIIGMSVKEIKEFLNQLPQQINNIQQFLATLKIAGQNVAQHLNLDTILNNSSNIAKEVIDKSINFTLGIVGVATVLVTIGIIVFFLSNDKEKIKNYVLKMFPIEIREKASVVMDDLEQKVGGYVTAQLLCVTMVGIIIAVCLSVMRVEYAVFLGFMSAVLDLIPVVGPVITGVIILLVAFPKGWIICSLAIGSLLFAQFVENNWARPYFFSKYMDLHPLIVIFSFVIAAKFLGVIGVLIAPAIAAVIVTLFDEIYIKIMNEDESNN